MNEYRIHRMDLAEVRTALAWAGREGWNPGLNDAACFHAADPDGFLVGRLDGEPVGVISAVRYGASLGFIGLYIVRPEFRGRGYGLKLWDEAMASLAGRNVGLDGVVEQQDNYKKSGFRYACRNIRFEGRRPAAPASGDPDLKELKSLEFDRVDACDRRYFCESRTDFVRQWISQPGACGYGIQTGGALRGYGLIRPCLSGFKVGPLFADDPELAGRLLDALLACIPDDAVFYLDVPEVNQHSVALAHRLGMRVVFETARMYTGEPPPMPMDGIFGVTTFELG